MNKLDTLYWKIATDLAESIEIKLVLNNYTDDNNLYVGLGSLSKENPECQESYTDITISLNSLPPFYAYVDNRSCNRHVHDFLTNDRIAKPAGFEYQGFRMFRFSPDRLKEFVPKQFKTISVELSPQDNMIKDIIYQERHFPLRIVQDIYGICLVSSKKLEESLIEGVRNLDATVNELLDGICSFCFIQELHYSMDAELIGTIYARQKGGTNMKTGNIVFLKCLYKEYCTIELIKRLGCRWLVRTVGNGPELEVYEDELISEF